MQKRLADKIKTFAPHLIAISCVTNQFELAKQIIDKTKNLEIPIIIGGAHATIVPEEVINVDGVFGICIGEGEYALLELVKALDENADYTKIQNWWFKKGKKIIKNPIRPLIKNLDKLPPPDYEMFDYQRFINEFGVLQIFANRGCPYQCSYCINHILMNLYSGKGKFIRFRKVKNLIEELKFLKQKFSNIRSIEFFDDTFILNKRWLKEFAASYQAHIRIPFRCNVRADLINSEIVQILKKAGCYMVNMAIETGNESLRIKILNKTITDSQLINAFAFLKEADIKVYAHNMIGIPYETVEDVKKTIRLNKTLQVDDLQCGIFYPFPKTELYKLCKARRWISNRRTLALNALDAKTILNLPSISSKDVVYYHRIFKSEVQGKILHSLFFRKMAKFTSLIRLYLLLKRCQHRFFLQFLNLLRNG